MTWKDNVGGGRCVSRIATADGDISRGSCIGHIPDHRASDEGGTLGSEASRPDHRAGDEDETLGSHSKEMTGICGREGTRIF